MSAENESLEFSDQRGDGDVRSIGPFSRYPVTVNGWTVERLEANYRNDNDGQVELILDGRFAIDVPADVAGQVIEFVANAIAIGHGWSCHPVSPEWTPDNDVPPLRLLPWHRMHGIETAETDDSH